MQKRLWPVSSSQSLARCVDQDAHDEPHVGRGEDAGHEDPGAVVRFLDILDEPHDDKHHERRAAP
jgi:hypothetical protein